MNLTELKARAYDIIAQIESLQRELAQVNNQIANFEDNSADTDKS